MNDMTKTGTAVALVLPAPSELAAMLKTGNGLDATLASLKASAEAKAAGADVNTAKGRDLLRSAAYDVSKSKTEIVKRGKELTEEARKEVAAVNTGIKAAETFLDKLRDDIKAPAVEWEAAEEARKNRINAALSALRNHGMTGAEATDQIAAKANEIKAIEIGDDFAEYRSQAAEAKEAALNSLRDLYAAAKRREDDEAELAALRAEKAKLQAEAAERERIEQERIAAEQAEQRRKDEAARIEREKAEAVEQAKRDRIAAEQKAEADAKAKREADAAHRQEIRDQIRDALFEMIGHDAEEVADALMNNEICHCEVKL